MDRWLALRQAGLLKALSVAAAFAGLSVLLGACGGAPPASVAKIGSTTTAPATGYSAQLEKFASCMRSHGVPNFPDLVMTPNGPALPAGSTPGIDTNSPKVQAARAICQKFAPPSVPSGTPAGPTITPKDQLDYLKVSACSAPMASPTSPTQSSRATTYVSPFPPA